MERLFSVEFVVPGLPIPLRPRGVAPLLCLSSVRPERAILGENPPAGNVVEITLGPNLLALLGGELPLNLDPGFEVPDFPPEEWGQPAGGEPVG